MQQTNGLTEIIRTSGDIRRLLAQTMVGVGNGSMAVDRGLALAALSKAITESMQTEVNIAKVRVAMLQGGHKLAELTELGRLVIEDQGSVPTLSGQ